MNHAVDQITPSAKKKKIKLEVHLTKPFQLSVEPQTLGQVLVILLDNAVKYSPTGSTVVITAKNSRSSHIISVKDEGPGIDPADLPHIFDRFYRSDKARTKGGGTTGYGLGLAIAKQIIDAHGGSINLTSKTGKGTSATINLPKK